jgi:hypothetical protein
MPVHVPFTADLSGAVRSIVADAFHELRMPESVREDLVATLIFE